MPAVSVDTLTNGATPPILLVDFAPFSSAGTLSTLLAAGGTGHTVLLIDAVSDLCEDSGLYYRDELAAAYAAHVVSHHEWPIAVVGFCSAAPLAMRVAHALDQVDRCPTTIVVEPTWPNAASISEELQSLRADLKALAVEQEMPDDEADMFVAELLNRYRAWLSFTLATAAFTRPARADYVIASSDGAAAPAPHGWDGGHEETELPATAAELFTNDAVCHALLKGMAKQKANHQRGHGGTTSCL